MIKLSRGFGRFTELPIAAACPRMAPAMVAAVRRLVELGHRRFPVAILRYVLTNRVPWWKKKTVSISRFPPDRPPGQ